jgi:hypothetical protein
VNWTDRIFSADGTLRDVCVIGADIETWSRFLSALGDSERAATFYVMRNGNRVEAWEVSVVEIFAGLDANALSIDLAVRAGDVWLSGHMSTEEEIEFTFDPADLKSLKDREAILEFARWMSCVCGLRVVITDEAADHGVVPWLYTYG